MDDTWVDQERPVLAVVVEHDVAGERIDDTHVAERLGFDLHLTSRVIGRLVRADYHEAARFQDEDGEGWGTIRPTERARREVGQWPSADPWDRLLERLNTAIEEESEPSRREKLVGVRDSLLAAGREVGLGALGSVLASGMTGAF